MHIKLSGRQCQNQCSTRWAQGKSLHSEFYGSEVAGKRREQEKALRTCYCSIFFRDSHHESLSYSFKTESPTQSTDGSVLGERKTDFTRGYSWFSESVPCRSQTIVKQTKKKPKNGALNFLTLRDFYWSLDDFAVNNAWLSTC